MEERNQGKTMNTDLEEQSQSLDNASLSTSLPAVVELVLAAQAGDRDAFGLLFERYRAGIVALAMRRVRNADEAEELAQDVFVQAMQKINQLRVPEAFGGWLRRIVHRMAINRMTRRQAAASCDPSVLEATCFSRFDAPDEGAEDREEAADVRAAVARLGQLDRQTLQAFYLRGQTLVQMSDAFDAPVGTIKRRLHVARKRLAKEMEISQAV
jgi:RNA polymerase sigma-70 factor (ECF subfamily)